jgi:hypothetical protein
MTAPRVGDAMLRRPTRHLADLTVGEARAVFDASPKTQLLLLVTHGTLVSTVARDDVGIDVDLTKPASTLGSLASRTITPDVPLETARARMSADRRRLVVVSPSGLLLGLLCLRRSLTGFCSDDGVAQMRRERVKNQTKNQPDLLGVS